MIIGLFYCLSAYPALYAIVGTSLPNYKGMFLRGYGSQYLYTSGYGYVTHASGSLGVVQSDAIRNIEGAWHNSAQTYAGTNIGWFEPTGAITRELIGGDGVGGSYGDFGKMIFSASNVVPTATENRPVNKAVNYIIKAY